MRTGTGCRRPGRQGTADPPVSRRCILWRLSGCFSGSSVTFSVPLPCQPFEQSHRELLVQRRLSLKSPPNRGEQPLPGCVLQNVARGPCLDRLEEVVWVLVHGYHHHASL